jgi:cold shock protein
MKEKNMQTGTVEFWLNDRGFGFIKPHDGSEDVFVHISAVMRAGLLRLEKGQRVGFDAEPDRKRPDRVRARNLKLIDDGANEKAALLASATLNRQAETRCERDTGGNDRALSS